ncbi:MAG TPA: hypothetical protein EYG93_05795 [Sulfurospirillum arcachonense]|nr:hypothetical protein [Sulfurospirillum arcachonense]HIP44827.1 hypothetical protein [Sulfurospirillum arcachonense]
MKKVLLLSAGSPCRAIMAESILTKYVDESLNIDFVGAGLENNSTVNEDEATCKALAERIKTKVKDIILKSIQ